MEFILTGLIGLFTEGIINMLSPIFAGSRLAGHQLSYIVSVLISIVSAVQMKADVLAAFGIELGVWGQVATGFIASRFGNYLHNVFASKKEKLDDYSPEEVVGYLVARYGINEEEEG